jgi:hypothetical protein
MQSRSVLSYFGSLYPEEDEYSRTMGPGDWVSFLVRFHPLIHEAEPSPEHGYKISEIHDLTFGSPQWFIFGTSTQGGQGSIFGQYRTRHVRLRGLRVLRFYRIWGPGGSVRLFPETGKALSPFPLVVL